MLACSMEKELGLGSRLLRQGVYIPLEREMTLRDFLEHVLALSEKYVCECVQTIFLNGFAVDSLDAPVQSGSRLALSAAMPGVAGAALRRDGVYGHMRGGITLGTQTCSESTARKGWVHLFCYNSIAEEQGQNILMRGSAIPLSHLEDIPLGENRFPAGWESPLGVPCVWFSATENCFICDMKG